MEGYGNNKIRTWVRLVPEVLARQGGKGFKAMRFALVLEHLDCFCHRWLVTQNRPCLFKVPSFLEAAAAEMVFTRRPVKWFTACATERFPEQADILQACCAIGDFLTALQNCGAAQARYRKKYIKEGRPEFYSENIVHCIPDIDACDTFSEFIIIAIPYSMC